MKDNMASGQPTADSRQHAERRADLSSEICTPHGSDGPSTASASAVRCPLSAVGSPLPVVRLLPETVANQIAAGEVVERPASVVKELVENALDAGATRIEVSVEQGGAKLVQVDDNGCGMDHESARLSLQRQATSKIATVHDITHIATFGFRGEAIPSIASVSRFILTTRPRSQADATRLTVIGGKLEEDVPAGHPFGTSITVSDLFFNTPARKKFLRSANTELARIRQALAAVALAHPAVALRLIADGRDLLRLPQGDALEDRIRALLGQPTADALLPLDHTSGPFHIHGYLSKPGYVRGGTPEQFIFINRRPATAPQIQVALRQAWPLRDTKPLVILFIDLPPEEVDVNVHPTKREVRFRRGNLVGDAVAQAIARALAATFPAPGAAAFDHTLPAGTAPTQPPPTPQPPPQPTQALQPIPPASSPLAANPFPPFPLSPVAPLPTPQAPKPRQQHFDLPGPAPKAPGQGPAAPTAPWKWLRIADILQERYWLVVTDQGYLVVDAKAALERILYERILADTERAPATQPLLIPETLRLPLLDAERVTRFLPELQAAGFDLSPLDHETFLINTLPVAFAEFPPKEVVADIAANLDQGSGLKRANTWRREVVARAAARAAANTFRPNSKEAAEALMAQLAQCQLPYATPRGKPVMLLTSYRELERRFQQ